MKTASLAGIAILAVSALAAPTLRAQDNDPFADPTAVAPASMPVQTVAPADVLKLVQSGDKDIALVDTQPVDGYAEVHIAGALNYPWTMRIKDFPIALPRNKTLIFYGSCPNDTSDMVSKLAQFGYYNVKIMEGGIEKWQSMKYPVAGKAAPDTDLSQLTAPKPGALAQPR